MKPGSAGMRMAMKNKTKPRKKRFPAVLAAALLAFAVLAVVVLAARHSPGLAGNVVAQGTEALQEAQGLKETHAGCITSTEERTVRGQSLSGLIGEGETVEIQFGYYSCNEVQREDIVAYSYAGNEVPIIKVARAVPGDTFGLEKAENSWNVVVNGKAIANSQGQLYALDDRAHQMLSLYVKDYKGIIPENTYLLLGNQAGGSLDSGRFGLVSRSGILGKVVVK